MAYYCALSFALTLLFSLPLHAAIPEQFRQIATKHQIPVELLYVVSFTESGLNPYAINVAGKSYFYQSEQDACDALSTFTKTTSPKRIDIGIGQTNLGYNGHLYLSPCQGFSLVHNLNVTATLLAQCYQRDEVKSWLKTAACYHRPAGGKPAQAYKTRIQQNYHTLFLKE